MRFPGTFQNQLCTRELSLTTTAHLLGLVNHRRYLTWILKDHTQPHLLSPSFTTPLCTSPAPRIGNIWSQMACIQGKLGHLALSPEHRRDRFLEGLGKLCREQALAKIQGARPISFKSQLSSSEHWDPGLCLVPQFSPLRDG